MKIIEEIKNNEVDITSDITTAIVNCMNKTRIKCHSTPQEPDFVAGLMLDFGPELASILKHRTSGLTLTFNSILCHQSPKVKTTYGTTEIGDILFVLYNKDKKGEILLNSLLLQAKVAKESISPTDTQLKLYKEWPVFTYVSPARLISRIHIENPTCGGKRDVLPKTINIGAKYMIVESNPDNIITAVADERLTKDTSLAFELVRFLTFSSGRTFEHDYSGNNRDDWTNIIWDLIKEAKHAKFTRTNSDLVNQPRGNETPIYSLNGNLNNSFFFSDNIINLHNDSPKSKLEGVSVIAIELVENEFDHHIE